MTADQGGESADLGMLALAEAKPGRTARVDADGVLRNYDDATGKVIPIPYIRKPGDEPPPAPMPSYKAKPSLLKRFASRKR
jgi:hypothetical protein